MAEFWERNLLERLDFSLGPVVDLVIVRVLFQKAREAGGDTGNAGVRSVASSGRTLRGWPRRQAYPGVPDSTCHHPSKGQCFCMHLQIRLVLPMGICRLRFRSIRCLPRIAFARLDSLTRTVGQRETLNACFFGPVWFPSLRKTRK